MHSHLIARAFAVLICLGLAGCGEEATLPVSAGTGPNPELPPPVQTTFPTVVLAKATGWPNDETPQAADGLSVNAFATDLDHPRMLYVLPNSPPPPPPTPPSQIQHSSSNTFNLGLGRN